MQLHDDDRISVVGLNGGAGKGLRAKEVKPMCAHIHTHLHHLSQRLYVIMQAGSERQKVIEQEMKASPHSSVSVTTGFRQKQRHTHTDSQSV